MQTILLIEDEQSIADTVVHCAEREGFEVEWLVAGREGLGRIRRGGIALVVLDVGLPDCNGFDLCKDIRTFSTVPVIFLTARDDEIDRVVGFEIGADDYVSKPFSPRELGVRIKAVLRRSSGLTPPVPDRSGLIFVRPKMRAFYGGPPLELTR